MYNAMYTKNFNPDELLVYCLLLKGNRLALK